ncbi:MAG: LysR family transcriptional regulator [Clostridia bacterium]|nr:LysR family transcriptional regulator [Clostridia bacterium]MBR3460158.1 LysR family transcriptional regulator [Clostridia bacterium]
MKSITNPAKYAVLLTVSEAGSLTSAAERLGYTQSGISHIIADLEAECGFPLILRNKSGSKLTRDGEKLIEPIRALIRSQEQLTSAIDEINGLRSGHVRVGMFSSVAVHWAPEITSGFTSLYPNIKLELFSGLYHEIENKVLSEELDCGFLTKHTKQKLDFTELSHDRLLAVVPRAHPFSKLSRLPVSLIEKEDFIIPGEGTGYDIGNIFKSCHITPRVKYALSDDYAALSMVERGLGITILPELILEGRADNVSVLEFDPPFHRTIGLVSHPGRSISPAARAFMEFVKDFASRHGSDAKLI